MIRVVSESKKDDYSDPFLLYNFVYQCACKGTAGKAAACCPDWDDRICLELICSCHGTESGRTELGWRVLEAGLGTLAARGLEDYEVVLATNSSHLLREAISAHRYLAGSRNSHLGSLGTCTRWAAVHGYVEEHIEVLLLLQVGPFWTNAILPTALAVVKCETWRMAKISA